MYFRGFCGALRGSVGVDGISEVSDPAERLDESFWMDFVPLPLQENGQPTSVT